MQDRTENTENTTKSFNDIRNIAVPAVLTAASAVLGIVVVLG
ncbi:hypothetical protein [Raineyella fluvialis]|nr:hypothetical protein [Raineyella fluvialis]